MTTSEVGSNWTLVTCYFVLQNYVRDPQFYIENAKHVMSLDCNLIIFTDRETYTKIYMLRKSFGLLHKTFFYTMTLDELPLMQYKTKIESNRKIKPVTDSRNTPTYFILTVSKFHFIKMSLGLNPFSSTHFGWIDFGYAYSSTISNDMIKDVMKENRSKFSICWIDYTNKKTMDNLAEYYSDGKGRCGIACNFFTGAVNELLTMAQLIETEFVQTIKLGYGHCDEQLFPPIFFKNRHLFHIYYGDYKQSVLNYNGIKDNYKSTLHYFIKNARKDEQYDLAENACLAVWKSMNLPNIDLTNDEKVMLIVEHYVSAYYLKKYTDCINILKKLEPLTINPVAMKFLIDNTACLLPIIKKNGKKIIGVGEIAGLDNSDLNKKLDFDKNVIIYYGKYDLSYKSLIINNPIYRPYDLINSIDHDSFYA